MKDTLCGCFDEGHNTSFHHLFTNQQEKQEVVHGVADDASLLVQHKSGAAHVQTIPLHREI
jgi:tryptophanyl-tRNA synthetase